MKPPNTSRSIDRSVAEHRLEWDERLLDWLDGDDQNAVFATHLHTCALCQQRVEEFSQLDAALTAAHPATVPSESFDARLFERIHSMSEEQRAAARRRIEDELQDNLRALARGWRRSLAFVAAGVCGGIAVAFALAGDLQSAGVTGKIAAEGASQFGGDAGTMQMILTALLGAAIGGFMSGWVARATE